MKLNKYLLADSNKKYFFIKNLFLKYDPLGLIEGGAPEDEYDEEILKIISKLKTCKDKKDLYNLIIDVFKEIAEVNVSKCKKNAEIIWNEFGTKK